MGSTGGHGTRRSFVAFAFALTLACASGRTDAPHAAPRLAHGGCTAGESFTFLAWGDTKGNTAELEKLSRSAAALRPALTLFTGDLEVHGFTPDGIAAWSAAMDGGDAHDGLFEVVFPIRGNHDDERPASGAAWSRFFDVQRRAAAVGAGETYRTRDGGLTYSFDYCNAHFVGLDVPGDCALADAELLAWLRADLCSAEQRGVSQAFLFWHGPIYSVTDYHPAQCTEIAKLVSEHPIVTATFHGHEHVNARVQIDSKRMAGVGREFTQIVSGGAGANPHACNPSRSDECSSQPGFAEVRVSGRRFELVWHLRDGKERRPFVVTRPVLSSRPGVCGSP